jgi:hypothetical protein
MPTLARDSSSGGAPRWHLATAYCIEQWFSLLAYVKKLEFRNNQPLYPTWFLPVVSYQHLMQELV